MDDYEIKSDTEKARLFLNRSGMCDGFFIGLFQQDIPYDLWSQEGVQYGPSPGSTSIEAGIPKNYEKVLALLLREANKYSWQLHISPQDKEDFKQEFLARCLKSFSTWEPWPDKAARAYRRTIALNLRNDSWSRQQKLAKEEKIIDELTLYAESGLDDNEFLPREFSTEDKAIARELAAEMADELSGLGQSIRKLFLLMVYEEITDETVHADISDERVAQILHMHPASVRQSRNRLQRKLKKFDKDKTDEKTSPQKAVR